MGDPLVSVVVTSYKRYGHLKRAIDAFRSCCTYKHIELILCDDGSPRAQQEQMRLLPFDVFVFSRSNRGIGANINNGLRVGRGEYVFYLQDDQVLTKRCDFLQEAIDALQSIPGLGLVFVGHRHEMLQHHKIVQTQSGLKVRLPVYGEPDSYQGIYVYSQKPHLKIRALHERLGYFAEGLKGAATEEEFCLRFQKQDQYQAGQVEGHEGLINDIGFDVSYFKGKGRWRQNWRHRIKVLPATNLILKGYDALPESARWILRGTPSRMWIKSSREEEDHVRF